jgi:ubiquinone/menaquinone biosynthesis C-methylase UbiE
MSEQKTDKVFSGQIPEIYDAFLVPLIFAPYAGDLARRIASRRPKQVLELAAGTGVVTRAMAETLPRSAHITATDLNQPMIDKARAVGTARPVEWRPADAMRLPFADASFDAVVCQFGVMFFAAKNLAFSEVRRVLRPGGAFLFNVWDRIEENEFADVVTEALESIFPQDPPAFMRRTPHGYFDTQLIRGDLEKARFDAQPYIETIAARSRADSPASVAIAYCQGTPLRNEIGARDAARLLEATEAAASAVAQRFGDGAVDGKIQAHVIVVET